VDFSLQRATVRAANEAPVLDACTRQEMLYQVSGFCRSRWDGGPALVQIHRLDKAPHTNAKLEAHIHLVTRQT
jgi:hypothetical protein